MRLTETLYLCVLTSVITVQSGKASIEGSKHDFRSQGSDTATGSYQEICAFCHTPVGGESTPDSPLWSPWTTNEEKFGHIPSFGTTDLEEDVIGPVSLTCLSCHDGTQASDATYVGRSGPAFGASPRLVEDSAVSAGALTSPVDPLLDHPVHVPYARGACAGIETDCDPAATAKRIDDFAVAQFNRINSEKSWWVDTPAGLPGIREKSDMILYPRDFGGTVGPAVECGSCHDPHDGRKRPVSFLRMPADSGAICETCHVGY
jgi:predicted CXXCH cytochrome family protein